MEGNRPARHNNEIITKLFFRLLPVQILIVAMGAVNSIVDGTVAGRCIDAGTVGVVGLFCAMVNVLEATGAVLLGGTAVLCGRSMGNGDIPRTSSIFSLNLTATFLIGTLITAFCLLMTGTLADILGASAALKGDLMLYIRGYALGILPQMLSQQIAAFLQMERQSTRGYIGVAGLIVSNVLLDLLLVAVLKLGIWGLALATALSNWVYFLLLAPYYLTGRGQLRFRFRSIVWREIWPMVGTGLPGALLVFCLALRNVVLNRILLRYSGGDGLSALAAYNMISGLFIAFALGTGAVVRILGSVFMGEEDRDSLKQLIRIAIGRMLPVSLAVMLAIALLSGTITALFFPDRGSEVFRLTRQLFLIYAFCIPLIVLCQIFTNYLQAGGHRTYVNLLSVFDGFFAMAVPALLLAPRLGALGVWLANPIGIVLTLLMTPLYACVFWRRLPRTWDEWLFLRPDFGVPDEDRLDLSLHSLEEVSRTAEQVQGFCEAHRIDGRTAHCAALCLEEMAGNVLEHGFAKDKKRHSVNIRVVCKDREILLRLKDDCVPFNPQERAQMLSPEEPEKNIGLRIVCALANEMLYHNLLGLNVLTIRLSSAA